MKKIIGLCLLGLTIGCTGDPVTKEYLEKRTVKTEHGCVFFVRFTLGDNAHHYFKPEQSDPGCPLLEIKIKENGERAS